MGSYRINIGRIGTDMEENKINILNTNTPTYEEVIAYMYSKLPAFSRIGAAAYKEGLGNIGALCAYLGNPHEKFPTIHIAGTNGKGSTSTLIAHALIKSKYKTGIYTSPHIKDFRERIAIDCTYISQEKVIEFIVTHQEKIEEIQPSFFEITVAMAFDFFAKEKVDIAVIEVGMGGLYDSTNIITPLVSVITNISKDHTQFLGDSLEKIAIQKAGIIKKNVPVVIGETHAETEKVFITKSLIQSSQILFADQLYQVANRKLNDYKQEITLVDLHEKKIYHYNTDLLGDYQYKNISTALITLKVLKEKGFITDFCNTNIFENVQQNLRFAGRYDIVKKNPDVIFDVSHNEAGIVNFCKQFSSNSYRKKYIILGFVEDKDINTILETLPKDAYYFFTQAKIPRALKKELLYQKAKNKGLEGEEIESVYLALDKSITVATQADGVAVVGSFFIMEEAYQWLAMNKMG